MFRGNGRRNRLDERRHPHIQSRKNKRTSLQPSWTHVCFWMVSGTTCWSRFLFWELGDDAGSTFNVEASQAMDARSHADFICCWLAENHPRT